MQDEEIVARLRRRLRPKEGQQPDPCCASCAGTAARVEALEWLVRAILAILVANLLTVLLR